MQLICVGYTSSTRLEVESSLFTFVYIYYVQMRYHRLGIHKIDDSIARGAQISRVDEVIKAFEFARTISWHENIFRINFTRIARCIAMIIYLVNFFFSIEIESFSSCERMSLHVLSMYR